MIKRTGGNDACLMLGHPLRRWPNIKPSLVHTDDVSASISVVFLALCNQGFFKRNYVINLSD